MVLHCPTCSQAFETTVQILNAHVASHYEDTIDPLRDATFIIDDHTSELSPSLKRKHPEDIELVMSSKFERYLANTSSESDDKAKKSKPGKSAKCTSDLSSKSNLSQKQSGTSRLGGRTERGDEWWSPVDCPISELPSNFTPGLIPVLRKVLLSAHHQGITRRAVLCAEGVCHIRSSRGFDNGWGCGYRNLEMALTALLVTAPHYRSIFPSIDSPGQSDSPGVRNLQIWMEAAWRDGYDEQGREQLGGKVVGTKKWIGPADIYPALAPKGIPCYLLTAVFTVTKGKHYLRQIHNVDDFAQPPGEKRGHSSTPLCTLIEYVERYFTEEDEGSISATHNTTKTAFDQLMKSGSSGVIRMTKKLPLIFQHDGHSRTIVGYEVNAQGKTSLLLFDPGHDIPKDLRRSAIEGFAERVGRDDQEVCESGSSDDEQADGAPIEVHSDEEVSRKGWVKKKANKMKEKAGHWWEVKPEWETKPLKALKEIRVNPNELSKYPEFQLLRFTGGPLLSQEERDNRRVISSERMT